MKKYYINILLVIITMFPVFSLGQTAMLMGEVLDKNTGKPLANATINIKNGSGEIVKTATSDPRFGDYEIDSIVNGIYTIEYVQPGYKTRVFDQIEIYPKHILVKNVELIEEFTRFSAKKSSASPEQDYFEDENVTQYLMYSGLTMIVIAAIALR